MTELDRFVEQLKKALGPEARVTIDAPDNAKGPRFVDVRWKEKWTPVEWREGMGFGFLHEEKAEPHGYGEGPDVVVTTVEEAVAGTLKALGVVLLKEGSPGSGRFA